MAKLKFTYHEAYQAFLINDFKKISLIYAEINEAAIVDLAPQLSPFSLKKRRYLFGKCWWLFWKSISSKSFLEKLIPFNGDDAHYQFVIATFKELIQPYRTNMNVFDDFPYENLVGILLRDQKIMFDTYMEFNTNVKNEGLFAPKAEEIYLRCLFEKSFTEFIVQINENAKQDTPYFSKGMSLYQKFVNLFKENKKIDFLLPSKIDPTYLDFEFRIKWLQGDKKVIARTANEYFEVLCEKVKRLGQDEIWNDERVSAVIQKFQNMARDGKLFHIYKKSYYYKGKVNFAVLGFIYRALYWECRGKFNKPEEGNNTTLSENLLAVLPIENADSLIIEDDIGSLISEDEKYHQESNTKIDRFKKAISLLNSKEEFIGNLYSEKIQRNDKLTLYNEKFKKNIKSEGEISTMKKSIARKTESLYEGLSFIKDKWVITGLGKVDEPSCWLVYHNYILNVSSLELYEMWNSTYPAKKIDIRFLNDGNLKRERYHKPLESKLMSVRNKILMFIDRKDKKIKTKLKLQLSKEEVLLIIVRLENKKMSWEDIFSSTKFNPQKKEIAKLKEQLHKAIEQIINWINQMYEILTPKEYFIIFCDIMINLDYGEIIPEWNKTFPNDICDDVTKLSLIKKRAQNKLSQL